MVRINGITEDLAGKTVCEALTEMNLSARLVVVELNGKILPKTEYETTVLYDEDTVEVITLVGGG